MNYPSTEKALLAAIASAGNTIATDDKATASLQSEIEVLKGRITELDDKNEGKADIIICVPNDMTKTY